MNAPERTDKPWGYELLIARTPHYVGKILFVRKGESLSLQYHSRKDETIHLYSGRAELVTGPDATHLATQPFPAGMSVHLPPGTIHRLRALTDCTFFEASTPELDDVVRVDDKYGRTTPA